MNILDISILAFVIMETANVIILYFKPEFRYGNGVAIFNEWEKSKEDETVHLFAKYMANWVAGVKLIFIVLLLVIMLTCENTTKAWAVGVMILSIASYFWKLHPIIKKLDEKNMITPKGYSKTLGKMIAGFMIMFSVALILYFII
ncbi:MAG: hypothetical protein R3Y45_02580 [Bacillota bacterium]